MFNIYIIFCKSWKTRVEHTCSYQVIELGDGAQGGLFVCVVNGGKDLR
jgi:hypothetical protein